LYEAQKAGHLDPKVDPTRLAFEIHAVAMGAHWASQLLDDRHAYSRARTIVIEKLPQHGDLCVPAAPLNRLHERDVMPKRSDENG